MKTNELAIKIEKALDDFGQKQYKTQGVDYTDTAGILEVITPLLAQHFHMNCPVCFNVGEIVINAQPDGIHHRTNYFECPRCNHFQDLDIQPTTRRKA